MDNIIIRQAFGVIGSLWPIIVLIIFGSLACHYIKYNKKARRNENTPREKEKKEVGNNYSEKLMRQGEAYVSKAYLMTPAEREIYRALEKRYGEKYIAFSQVRVADLIKPNFSRYNKNSREYISLFRQVSQWHFDYVLCERSNIKIFCAIELDNSSHRRAERARRDEILDKVCEISGVRLKRIRIKDKGKVIEVIKNA